MVTQSVISASGCASHHCTASSIALFPCDANLDPPAPQRGAIRVGALDSCASARRRLRLTRALAARHKQVQPCEYSREKCMSLPGLQFPEKLHPLRIVGFPAANLVTTIAVHEFPDCPKSIRHSTERIALDASSYGVHDCQTRASVALSAPLFPGVD